MFANSKKFIALALLCTASVGSVSIVSATETSSARLSVGGKAVALASPVVNQDGYNLASMREIMTALGAEISWAENTKTVTATRDGKTIVVQIGADNALVNGVSQKLDMPAKIVDDKAYVPIGFVARSLGYNAQWYADSKTIVMNDISVSPLQNVKIPTYAKNLTQESAIQTAIKKSNSLKNLSNKMNDLRLSQDDIADQLATLDTRAASLPSIAVNQLSSAARSVLFNLESLQFSLDSEQYQREITEGALALSVKSSFLSILSKQSDIAVGKAQAEMSAKSLEHSKLMLELGMLSETDYEKTKLSHEQLLSNITVLERALDAEYSAINKLLDNNDSDRFNVIFDDTFTPIKDDFLIDNYVTTGTASSPLMRLAEIDLEKAETSALIYAPVSMNEYRQGQTAITAAEMNLGDTKRSHESNIRNAYATLRDIEAQIKAAELDLQIAKTAVTTAQLQFDTGSLTELELIGKVLEADVAERGIEFLKMSHSLRRFMFENPFLLVSSSQQQNQ